MLGGCLGCSIDDTGVCCVYGLSGFSHLLFEFLKLQYRHLEMASHVSYTIIVCKERKNQCTKELHHTDTFILFILFMQHPALHQGRLCVVLIIT